MRKQVVFLHRGCDLAIAWISFQPDGSISCGLRDRTFIARRINQRIGIWNACNRVKITCEVPYDAEALTPVENPHFTYHPPGIFHLKGNADRSNNGEDLFSGVARVEVVLQQERRMPWLRLVSKPLNQINSAGPGRSDGIESENLSLRVPDGFEQMAAVLAVSFVALDDVANDGIGQWGIPWHGLGLRIRASLTFPQQPLLSWFHAF